jgi:hypothetical protein
MAARGCFDLGGVELTWAGGAEGGCKPVAPKLAAPADRGRSSTAGGRVGEIASEERVEGRDRPIVVVVEFVERGLSRSISLAMSLMT